MCTHTHTATYVHTCIHHVATLVHIHGTYTHMHIQVFVDDIRSLLINMNGFDKCWFPHITARHIFTAHNMTCNISYIASYKSSSM